MNTSKIHGGMPVGLQPNLHVPTTLSGQSMTSQVTGKTFDSESMDLVAHIQDMLNQLLNRGINSMLVTVGPLGEIGIHGSHKGQTFLKENPDIADRFSKICSDDVWTLIGAQKRFLELGRSGQNKTNYNDKTDFPLDFSHERDSYFQTENRPGQDNSFVQGILSQTGNQNKGYQPNSFLPGNFNQYIGDSRNSYPNMTFFQGGFSQGGNTAADSFPQPSFMPSIDQGLGNLSANTLHQVPSTSNTNTSPPVPHDKNAALTQSEADLIKEMLSNSQIQDVLKGPANPGKIIPKEKVKEEKESPDKKKEAIDNKRKRERRPETWQRNIKKKLKTEGKAYTNARGKEVPEKKLQSVDCSKCKQRCAEKISEETRQKIFDWFWKLGSYTAQKEFVVSRVTQVRTKTNKRRSVHRLFSFEINGNYVSVCKPFFSKTLGIGDSYIFKAFEQKARDLFVQDGRGKHTPVNKTTEDQIDSVHHHLECYLSGYTTEKPLPKNIHAVKWYDEYITMCQEFDQKPVSKHIYRRIFQEYTLKFPKSPEKKNADGKDSNSTEQPKPLLSDNK